MCSAGRANRAAAAARLSSAWSSVNAVPISVRNVKDTNDIFKQEKKHYITLFVVADYDSGVLELKEPEKCEKWDWFEWIKLPEPSFLPIKNLLKQNFKLPA